MLGVAAFFLLSPRKGPTGTVNVNKPGGPGEQKKEEDKPPPPPVDTKKYEPTPTALNDAENARLTNLLPNDSEHIAHYCQRELFQPNSTLYDAVFKTPGALDDAVLRKRLGFSVLAIDDLIHAEKHSGPGAAWTFTVIHFSELIKEADLKTALKLKPAGASIEGQPYYKTSEPHPWLDTLARFSFGIPNYTRIFEPRRLEQPTYVRIHNPQTLILGDEAPVVAFLKAKGQFQQQTIRAVPPPTPVVPPTPSGMMGGMTGMMGGMTGMMGGVSPMPMPPPARPGGNPMGAPKVGMLSPSREQAALAFDPASGSFSTPRPEFVRFAFTGNDQAQPPPAGGGGGNQLNWLGTGWDGVDEAKQPIHLDIIGETAVIIDQKSKFTGKWQTTDGTNVTLTFDNGMSYQGVVDLQAGTFTGNAKNAMKSWPFSFTKIALTDSTPTPGTGSSREDMYLTIKPALKAILDRMELRSDNRDKILVSSATDMDANVLVTNTPELKDIVLRRPRQFWDVTLLLPEQKPRIRMLGTALLQRDPLRYQLRNEITCAQELDAKTFKQEITDRASHTIRKFLKNLVKHEVRLAAAAPETKQPGVPPVPPPPPPGQPPVTPDDKKPAPDVKSSQITVNQQANTVDFVLDLVLDQPTLRQVEGIASLTAGSLRVAMEAAASFSVRHNLASAGRMLGDKGLSEREVAPGQFPPGALVRKGTTFTDREPRNRISWMAGLLPYMGQQHLYERINFEQSWRDPSNWMPGSMIVPQFLDPSYPSYARQVAVGELPLDFGATHYVGIAGVGLDAAAYKRGDPATVNKRGVFGYDESASLDEIGQGRGVSNTIVAIQVPHDGLTGVSPWIAGGGATVRGVPEKNSIAPFVLSKDKNGNTIQHQGKKGTYAVMADGSVRFIDQTVSDAVFKAMCTVNGPAPEDFNLDSNPATPLVPGAQTVTVDPPVQRVDKTPPTKVPEPSNPIKPADKTPPVADSSGKLVVQGNFSIDAPPGDTSGGCCSKRRASLHKRSICVSEGKKSQLNLTVLAKIMPSRTPTNDQIIKANLDNIRGDKDEECASFKLNVDAASPGSYNRLANPRRLNSA